MPRARVVPLEAKPLVLDAAVKAARARSLRAEWLVALAERDRACAAAIGAGASFRAVAEATQQDLAGVQRKRKRLLQGNNLPET